MEAAWPSTVSSQLPIVLCGTMDWTSGVTLRFSSSNGGADANTAAWAVYNPSYSTFSGMGVVKSYLPTGCGGSGWTLPQAVVGQSVQISNGAIPSSLGKWLHAAHLHDGGEHLPLSNTR